MAILEHDNRMAGPTDVRNGYRIEPEEFLASSSVSGQAPADPAKSAKSGRIVGRISQFLADHKPFLFCDDCITDKLGLSSRRQANRVTSRLAATSNFWRSVGACSACGKHKQVVRNV